MNYKKIGLALLIVAVAAVLVYQIPWVKERVDWRIDIAKTFVFSRLNPAGELPPPEVVAEAGGSNSPASSPTAAAASPTPQFTPTPLPGAVRLTPAAHEVQGPNNCGPATMTMYLRYYGWEGDQYDISDEVKPVSADRNVNVDELIYYTSNWAGWLKSTYRVGGDLDLLKQFLAAGIPVMVEKGHVIEIDYLFNDDYWNGHYALVTGYDDAAHEFIFQDSYNGAEQQMGYAEFDEFWQQFNRVFILVYLPEREEDVKGLLGADWDEDANRQNAMAVSEAEIEADPQDPYAWFNLGMNQVYFEDYGAASNSFDQARSIGLPMRMLRYQFGPFFAYYNANRMDDLNELVDYALQITDASEEALIWKGWSLYREGDNNGAIAQFWLAYDANPKSVYAQQALNFMGVTP